MFWFDLDNSPHVPLFRPVFGELRKRGYEYCVTARDFAQTEDLLKFWEIPHTMVGGHGGKSKLKKIFNLLQRSQELGKEVKGKEIAMAVSHGSRTQLVASWRLKIPSILMLDYEHTEARIFNILATYLLMPSYIPADILSRVGFNLKKIIRYNGFKEEIYLKDFVPNANFREEINIDAESILVTIRPPSTVGNYHDRGSEVLFQKCLEYFSSDDGAHCLVVNRTPSELDIIPPHLRSRHNISILPRPVDGLQLIWASDIVISGGGTMNRESALLGVPTFSIFTGATPFLDLYLQNSGKLFFIKDSNQIIDIPLKKRYIPSRYEPKNIELASQITDVIIDLSKKSRK